ncbi:MAG: hypothetical protein ACT4N1_06600 [Nitrososphaerota archaeon]
METISQKTVSIEFEGRKYVIQGDITLHDFLSNLGLSSKNPITLKSTKEGGLVLIVK